jgi:P27 family predicted phage terminase small subunit
MAKKTTTKRATKRATKKRTAKRSQSAKAAAKPKPKPKAKRAASGKSKSSSTAKADRISSSSSRSSPNPPEPPTTLPCSTPEPPSWLKNKPIACSKWRELIEDLRSRQLLASVDFDLFALYCDAWQQFDDADKQCKRSGTTFETDKGYVAIHPAKLIRDKSTETIQRIADRLGIGINKRRGLKVVNTETGESDGDPIAEYAKRKPRKCHG